MALLDTLRLGSTPTTTTRFTFIPYSQHHRQSLSINTTITAALVLRVRYIRMFRLPRFPRVANARLGAIHRFSPGPPPSPLQQPHSTAYRSSKMSSVLRLLQRRFAAFGFAMPSPPPPTTVLFHRLFLRACSAIAYFHSATV